MPWQLLANISGEFVIDKYYRFEGISDPVDEAVVYAISSPAYNIKGVLVNGYVISSERIADEMIQASKKRTIIKGFYKHANIVTACNKTF